MQSKATLLNTSEHFQKAAVAFAFQEIVLLYCNTAVLGGGCDFQDVNPEFRFHTYAILTTRVHGYFILKQLRIYVIV